MTTPQRLRNSDFCRRREFLERSWELNALTPMQLLSRAVTHGLLSKSKEPDRDAADWLLETACKRPLDTPREDLLGIVEHHQSLAEMIVWILREGPAWERPEAIRVGKHLWEPESFLGPNRTLRRVVLCDHWDEQRAIAETFDWATQESVLYGMPINLIVVVLGPSRDGRRHGPLAKGWIHPVSQQLRFRRRDGTGFDGNWKPIFREHFKGDQAEWLESMQEDQVLDETILVHPVEIREPDRVRALAGRCLDQMQENVGLPDIQLGQCFDVVRKCPFRSACPYFREPSESLGFIKLRRPLKNNGGISTPYDLSVRP